MDDGTAPRFGYPVFLDLHDVLVLVVGGGAVGARKVAGLTAAGARVRLVADRVSAAVDRAGVAELHERRFRAADLDGVRLVVTATGDETTDRAVTSLARDRGLWVNAADQPVDCDFILPAIIRQGPLSVAVSSDGESPAMAQFVRDRVAELLDERLVVVTTEVARRRAARKSSGASTEGFAWRQLIEDLLTGQDDRGATDPTGDG